jgi:hypothetical protein
MALGALPVERLRQYLRELPTGARALLITELERAALRGDDIPGGDMLLQEVRAALRESGERVPRIGNPARLFFQPIESFLTDAQSGNKMPGRIPRSALEPTWNWIARDLAPAECQAYCDEVNRTIAGGNLEPPVSLAYSLHGIAAERMKTALASAQTDEKLRRRIAAQLATPGALEDLRDIATILSYRDVFELIESRLPGHIRNLSEGPLESVKALLDSPLCTQQGLLPFAFIMVMNRLAAPWQLIRLAVKAVESDDAARIAASPYALAVTITLGDIERMIGDLRSGVAAQVHPRRGARGPHRA